MHDTWVWDKSIRKPTRTSLVWPHSDPIAYLMFTLLRFELLYVPYYSVQVLQACRPNFTRVKVCILHTETLKCWVFHLPAVWMIIGRKCCETIDDIRLVSHNYALNAWFHGHHSERGRPLHKQWVPTCRPLSANTIVYLETSLDYDSTETLIRDTWALTIPLPRTLIDTSIWTYWVQRGPHVYICVVSVGSVYLKKRLHNFLWLNPVVWYGANTHGMRGTSRSSSTYPQGRPFCGWCDFDWAPGTS